MNTPVDVRATHECTILELSPDVARSAMILNRYYSRGWRVVGVLSFSETRPNQVILERPLSLNGAAGVVEATPGTARE